MCLDARLEPRWICGIVFRKTDLGRVKDLVLGGIFYGIYGLYYFPVKALLTMNIEPLFLIGVSLHWRNANRKIWIRL